MLCMIAWLECSSWWHVHRQRPGSSLTVVLTETPSITCRATPCPWLPAMWYTNSSSWGISLHYEVHIYGLYCQWIIFFSSLPVAGTAAVPVTNWIVIWCVEFPRIKNQTFSLLVNCKLRRERTDHEKLLQPRTPAAVTCFIHQLIDAATWQRSRSTAVNFCPVCRFT